MKKFYSVALLLLPAIITYSQQLSQVSFAGGTTLTSIAFSADQGVLIRVSEEGRIIEWGIEVKSLRYDYYAPALQPFPGKVNYYGQEGDSISRGKIKSIGTTIITYYGPYETAEKIGKIKSIGSLSFDYFSQYENTSLKGKIKQAGNLALDYYGAYENEGIRGKLKSVGNSSITYYSSFDDKAIRGKIKSIGGVSYTWYTSLEPGKIGGALKTGSYRQNINGITYILR